MHQEELSHRFSALRVLEGLGSIKNQAFKYRGTGKHFKPSISKIAGVLIVRKFNASSGMPPRVPEIGPVNVWVCLPFRYAAIVL